MHGVLLSLSYLLVVVSIHSFLIHLVFGIKLLDREILLEAITKVDFEDL